MWIDFFLYKGVFEFLIYEFDILFKCSFNLYVNKFVNKRY